MFGIHSSCFPPDFFEYCNTYYNVLAVIARTTRIVWYVVSTVRTESTPTYVCDVLHTYVLHIHQNELGEKVRERTGSFPPALASSLWGGFVQHSCWLSLPSFKQKHHVYYPHLHIHIPTSNNNKQQAKNNSQ